MTIGGISSSINIIFVSFCFFVCLFVLQNLRISPASAVLRHDLCQSVESQQLPLIHRIQVTRDPPMLTTHPVLTGCIHDHQVSRTTGAAKVLRSQVSMRVACLVDSLFYKCINFDFVEMCWGAWVGACSKQMRSCTLACFLCHFVPNSNAQLERKSAAT